MGVEVTASRLPILSIHEGITRQWFQRRYPRDTKLAASLSSSGRSEEQKNFRPLSEAEAQILVRPDHSPVTIQTELTRLASAMMMMMMTTGVKLDKKTLV